MQWYERVYEDYSKAIEKDFERDIDSNYFLKSFIQSIGFDILKEVIIDYWNHRKYLTLKNNNPYGEFGFYYWAQQDINIVKRCL